MFMLKKIKTSPLYSIFMGKDHRHLKPFLVVLLSNFAAALMEGLSFAMILFALALLGGEKTLPILPFCSSFSPLQLFTLFIIAAIFLQLVRSGLTYVGQLLMTSLGTRIQTDFQERVCAQILNFSFPYVSQYKVGDLNDYAHIPTAVVTIIFDASNRFIVSILTVIGLFVLMTWLSFPLTVMTLILLAGLSLLQHIIIRKISGSSAKFSHAMVEFSKHIAQNLHGIRAIHTFNQQETILKKIHNILQQISVTSKKLNAWNHSILPINETTGITLVGGVLILGSYLLGDNKLSTLPLLLTFITVTYRLTSRLQVLMISVGTIAHYAGPLRRLNDILKNQDKEFTPKGGTLFRGFEETIEFQNVSLQYLPSQRSALKNLSLVLRKGETLAIVGSSGAGKSSLIDLLIRLYPPTQGEILVDGHPLDTFDLHSWRNHLGVVSQDPFIFNETIEENIRFGDPNASLEDLMEAAKTAGAHEFILETAQGYQTIVGERGYRLSGGERQRLALARALVRKPSLLILDEATSNLDSHSEQLIQRALEKIRKNTTMILIAHRLATISQADQILVLDKGEIVEQGSHHTLLQQRGKYAYFWHLQSPECLFRNSLPTREEAPLLKLNELSID
jgi:subfamily B ATP-binding cassette protein MsbA